MMMPPIKQEPIENSQELKSLHVECLPDILSETFEYSPDTSPSKRLKTLSSDSPSASSKGKSKILEEEEEHADSLSQQERGTCGVCLLEEGMSLRGFIDSCDHFFCFVCIMEWAKVESRCPICKRRFSTIRRPRKDGVFLAERIVDVPVRDQIYNYNGNATIGPHDPYSQIQCSVCCSSSDEHLLLLCDLCDSAAHSYCVGLGATVPEGDWFCKDCTISRDEHAKVETDTTFDDSNYNNHNPPSCPSTVQFAYSDVSIHDIVRESSTREPTSVDQSELIGNRSGTRTTSDQPNGQNARTLKRCLNVHSRIRLLRENWDGFRGGSLNFSSFEDNFGATQSQSTSENRPDIDKAWKMMDRAAKALGKNSATKNSVPRDSESHKRKERLLNDAFKVSQNSSQFMGLKKIGTEFSSSKKITASVHVKNNHYSSHNPSTTSNVVGSSDRSSSMAELSSFKKITESVNVKNNHNSSQNPSTTSNVVGSSDRSSSMGELSSSKKITASVHVKNNHYSSQKPSTTSKVVGSSDRSSSMAALSSSKKITASVHVKNNHYSTQNPSTTSNVVGSGDRSSSMAELSSSKKITASVHVKNNHYSSTTSNVVGSSDRSSSMAADKNCTKTVIDAPCKTKENVKKDKQFDCNIKEIENAKSEIQSLVKLNLKLLSREKKLEVDVFKEVARHATHSIMAACGIEPPRPRFRSFERVVCDHGQTRNRPISTLMPTSCRECFFIFIKDVVTTIASDKTKSFKP